MKSDWSQTGPSAKQKWPATRVSFALRSNNFQNFGDSAVSLKVRSGTPARTEISGGPTNKTRMAASAVAALIPRLRNKPLTNGRIFKIASFIPSFPPPRPLIVRSNKLASPNAHQIAHHVIQLLTAKPRSVIGGHQRPGLVFDAPQF